MFDFKRILMSNVELVFGLMICFRVSATIHKAVPSLPEVYCLSFQVKDGDVIDRVTHGTDVKYRSEVSCLKRGAGNS